MRYRAAQRRHSRAIFIARWPSAVQPGSTCDVPVINVDLYPTFLAAAKASPPEGTPLDGEGLLPLFRQDGKFARKSIYWHFPGYLYMRVPCGRDPIFRTRPVTVMNKNGWKLHLYHEEWQLDGGREGINTNDAVELYNLSKDIGERHNLALKNPGMRDEMLEEMLRWMAEADALIPTRKNPAFKESH